MNLPRPVQTNRQIWLIGDPHVSSDGGRQGGWFVFTKGNVRCVADYVVISLEYEYSCGTLGNVQIAHALWERLQGKLVCLPRVRVPRALCARPAANRLAVGAPRLGTRSGTCRSLATSRPAIS